MRQDVRIVLVGDDGVGKTTLLSSLVTESFNLNLPHVMQPVSIEPEVNPDNAATLIIDTSSRPEHRETLEWEMRDAHVICIMYDISDRESFLRVSSFWLPYIRHLGVNVPVILIGSKLDLKKEEEIENGEANFFDREIVPIMNEFKEVETYVECSAKDLFNVPEAFYYAQKAVLYPTAPLYDSREHVLKPACIDALRRIFKLCDLDGDGALNNDELNEFQLKCFNSPLQKAELEGVKKAVKEVLDDGVDERGLTQAGFVLLQLLFIQRGRLETTWTVLRQFGYGDDLNLKEEFLHPSLNIPLDCNAELSSAGTHFLTDLFAHYDRDHDGALNRVEMLNLFSTTPGIPWKNTDAEDYNNFPNTVVNVTGGMSLHGFLAHWNMLTLLNIRLVLEYLAYLGYPEDVRNAFKFTKPRSVEIKKGKLTKNVFLCYVFGAVGCGKTNFLNGFLRRDFEEKHIQHKYSPIDESLTEKTPNATNNSSCSYEFNAVNSVDIDGLEKYLVLQEIPSPNHREAILSQQMNNVDVICLLYDSNDVNSFSYIAKLYEKYELGRWPVVIVATKSDLDLVQQRYQIQPDVFCRQYGLGTPINISMKKHSMANVFVTLAKSAIYP